MSDSPDTPPGEAPTGDPGSTSKGQTTSGLERIGRYRIVRELGAGGMGAVYEAVDESMRRTVALKVLSRHFAPSTKADTRFEQEAWIAGRLNHPNIARVFDRGRHEELHYYSMELIRGGSLHELAERMREHGRDERFGLEFGSSTYTHWALQRVIDAARALHHAHEQGVIHRDLKPMNLMLDEDGTIKVVDFGLAIDDSVTQMTTDGRVLGSLAFMPPEQLLGKREKIGPATDVYALAVTLYLLLTMKLPFSGDTQQLYMMSVLSGEVRRPRTFNPKIGRDLETVLEKALATKPAERYTSAAEFAEDLENVLHLRPTSARPQTPVDRAWKWIRRKPMRAALIAALAVAVPSSALLIAREGERRATQRAERFEELMQRSFWLEQRRRYPELRETVSQALKLRPDDPQAWLMQAVALRDARDRAAASNEKGAPPELREEIDALLAAGTSRWPDEPWPYQWGALLATENAASERWSEQARQRSAAEPTWEGLTAEGYFAEIDGDWSRALDIHGRRVRERPNAVDAIGSLGMAHEQLGDYDRAIEQYRVALGLDPELVFNAIDLARVYTLRGLDDGVEADLDQAQSYADRALEQEPDSVLAREILSQLLIERGRVALLDGNVDEGKALMERGASVCEEGLALDDDNVALRINLGASQIQLSNLVDPPDKARLRAATEAFRQVLDRWSSGPPTDPVDLEQLYFPTLVNQCDALIRLGELTPAEAVCRRVVDLDPEWDIAHYNLAGLHALAGRPREALFHLRRDFELGDDDWRTLQADPWFESLRGDPEFEGLLDRMRSRADSAP